MGSGKWGAGKCVVPSLLESGSGTSSVVPGLGAGEGGGSCDGEGGAGVGVGDGFGDGDGEGGDGVGVGDGFGDGDGEGGDGVGVGDGFGDGDGEGGDGVGVGDGLTDGVDTNCDIEVSPCDVGDGPWAVDKVVMMAMYGLNMDMDVGLLPPCHTCTGRRKVLAKREMGTHTGNPHAANPPENTHD